MVSALPAKALVLTLHEIEQHSVALRPSRGLSGGQSREVLRAVVKRRHGSRGQ